MSWRDLGSGEVRPEHVEQRVKLAGWVARRRDHGGLLFIDLRDQTGLCQLVVNPERSPEAAAAAHGIRNEFVLQAEGEVAARDPANVNPNLPTGSRGGPGRPPRGHLDLPAAALPARRGERRRDAAPSVPLDRPAPGEAAAEHPAARADGLDHPARNGRRWLPRDRDADPLQADPRGRARLPRSLAAAEGAVLRLAAIAADPQAAPRHLRLRALLPDRTLLPRRGSARRPRQRARPARRGDGVPRGRLHHRADGADDGRDLARDARRSAGDPLRALDLRRLDGPLRDRQAGLAV